MCYPCSKNKGTDQLSVYRAADQRLCFHICKKQAFSQHAKILISLEVCHLTSLPWDLSFVFEKHMQNNFIRLR